MATSGQQGSAINDLTNTETFTTPVNESNVKLLGPIQENMLRHYLRQPKVDEPFSGLIKVLKPTLEEDNKLAEPRLSAKPQPTAEEKPTALAPFVVQSLDNGVGGFTMKRYLAQPVDEDPFTYTSLEKSSTTN